MSNESQGQPDRALSEMERQMQAIERMRSELEYMTQPVTNHDLAVQYSTAISMKRIAQSLSGIDTTLQKIAGSLDGIERSQKEFHSDLGRVENSVDAISETLDDIMSKVIMPVVQLIDRSSLVRS